MVKFLVFLQRFCLRTECPWSAFARIKKKYESHETCACEYLGGGLLGDTNRLGGEGVHVHFLEDMAFFLASGRSQSRFPQKVMNDFA